MKPMEFNFLQEHLENNSISLEKVREMSYDDLEALCNDLLKWKLFVANRDYVEDAIGTFMSANHTQQ